jgi:hypothetical protein
LNAAMGGRRDRLSRARGRLNAAVGSAAATGGVGPAGGLNASRAASA